MSKIDDLLKLLDKHVNFIEDVASKVDERVSDRVLETLLAFDTKGGAIDLDGNFYTELAGLTADIEKILNSKNYKEGISKYLDGFDAVGSANSELISSTNKIDVDGSLLDTPKKLIYDTVKAQLIQGVARDYVAPISRVLLNVGLGGASISTAKKVFENLRETGATVNGIKVNSLKNYATQIARDSLFGWQGTVNNIMAKEYGLNGFMYSGGLISDSRTVCKKVKALGKEITFKQLETLLSGLSKDDRQGMYPNTNTIEDFMVSRGGYNCRHVCIPVRVENVDEPFIDRIDEYKNVTEARIYTNEQKDDIYRKPIDKQYTTIYETIKGKVEIHDLAQPDFTKDNDDYQEIITLSKIMVDNGISVRILPEIKGTTTDWARKKVRPNYKGGRKDPDFLILLNDEWVYADLKRPQLIKNIKGNINNAILEQHSIPIITNTDINNDRNNYFSFMKMVHWSFMKEKNAINYEKVKEVIAVFDGIFKYIKK